MEKKGFSATAVMAHERKKVVLLFDHTDVEIRNRLKTRIRQIADRYGTLQGILIHTMPVSSQAEQLGQDTEMLDFSRPLFKFCTSYYASPTYQGDAHTSMATLARNAHVYLIGNSTIEVDKYIAAIAAQGIKIISVPLDDVSELEFSIEFAKELSMKRSGEIYEKLISLFEENHISFGGGSSTTGIGGHVYCLNNALSPADMQTMLQTFVDGEKECTLVIE